MAALKIVHLCPYNFQSVDPVVIGSEISAGESLSGLDEPIATDGGGYWQLTLNNGGFGGRSDDRRANTMAWRATQASFSGGRRNVVLFCDGYHQPIYGLQTVPHDDGTSFDDDTLYTSPGAQASVVAVINGQAGGNRATIIDISIASERSLIGGEKFTYIGANGWLDRCAEIESVADSPDNPGALRITLQPPIRGGIAIGDALDFDNVRCVMRRTSAPTNAYSPGALTTAVNSLVLVEDMRKPSV